MFDIDDSFRTVRVKLESEVDFPALVIVTSSSDLEGRVTVTGGIAKAFAEAGYATALLVRGADAGTYSPLTGQMRLATFSPGVSADLAPYRTAVPNLSGITLSERRGNGSLSAPDAESLAADLRREFQIVVADLGSVLGSPLALALARVSSGYVLAFRTGRTANEADRSTIEALKMVNSRALGIVTTESDKTRAADSFADTAPESARSGRTVEAVAKSS